VDYGFGVFDAVTDAPRTHLAGRVLLVLAAATVVFEQSPANEALRANLGFRALESTGSAVMAGLAVAGITVLIEGISSALVVAGVSANPDGLRRLAVKLRMHRELKRAFDPAGILNPGRIVRAPAMDDRSLFRYPPGYAHAPPETVGPSAAWETVLPVAPAERVWP